MKSRIIDDGFMPEVISNNSTISVNKNGKCGKTYKNLNVAVILNVYEDRIKSLGLDDLDFKVKIATQQEYLGFVSIITGKKEDRPKLRVKDVIPLRRKRDGVQFGYSIITQSIGSGIESRFTVFNRVLNNSPIKKDYVIFCTGYERDGTYFTMTGYTHIYA